MTDSIARVDDAEDVADSETETDTKRGTIGIGGRLYLAFGFLTALTLVACGAAWYAMDNLGRSLEKVTDQSVPALTASLELSALSAKVAATAPALVSATDDVRRQQISEQIATGLQEIQERSIALGEMDPNAAEQINALTTEMSMSLDKLKSAVDAREEAQSAVDAASVFASIAHTDFLDVAEPAVKSTVDRMSEAGQQTIDIATETIDELVGEQVATLRAALTIASNGQRMAAIISRTAAIKDLDQLTAEEQAFGKAAVDTQQLLKQLPETPNGDRLREVATALMKWGIGDGSAFEIRRGELNWVDLTVEQYEAVQAGRAALDAAVVELSEAFDQAALPVVEGARINLMTGSTDLADILETGIYTLVDEDVVSMRLALETLAEANRAAGIVNGAATAENDSLLIAEARKFAESAEKLTSLASRMRLDPRTSSLADAATSLAAVGEDPGNVFETRRAQIAAVASAEAALAEARDVAARFEELVKADVDRAVAAANQAGEAAVAEIDRGLMILAAVAAASALVGILIGWLVVNRQVVRRLTGLGGLMQELADGNNQIEVDTSGSDEISGMAQTVEVFRDNAIEVERMRADQLESERRASEERQQQRLELAADFESRVKSIIDRVGASAQQMEQTARALTDGASDVRHRSEEGVSAAHATSTNVQTVASAAEELSASIREISDKIAHSSDQARKANDQATATQRRVEGLEEAASRIDTVVNLITDIAEQTNLLALNATIEAARAGDAGKGFAVVANEVKSLASQTAKATDEITSQIKMVQDGVREAVGAIRGVASAIEEIDGNVTAIAGAVEEQGASTQEIARSTQDAAAGTSQVTETIEGVSAVANDTGGQAEAVLSAARELTGEAQTLDREVNAFLAQVRDGGRSA